MFSAVAESPSHCVVYGDMKVVFTLRLQKAQLFFAQFYNFWQTYTTGNLKETVSK